MVLTNHDGLHVVVEFQCSTKTVVVDHLHLYLGECIRVINQ